MKVPISWLKNYINVDEDNIDDLLHRLTLAGTEVESIETQGNWEGVVVGQVLEVSKHPNADRLNLVKVNSGENETLDVVCGANNLYVDQKVAFAPVGSKLFSPKSKKMETLKKSKIRGEISNGMICSALELGLGEDHEGILDLNKDFEIGKSLKDYYSDTIIDFELTPNRPDCLGIYGIAREVSAVTGSKLKNVQIYNKNSNNISDNLEIDIESKDLCKRYMGVVIDGVEITDSPEWLKSALISIGENPINNIVDITNYVMFELGQPLHAFDYKKINNNKIVVRNAKKGERLITLDEENRELNEDMLVIADSDFPVALAGIKGGKESGIQSSTSKIVLESACFEGGNNRKTANHFDLKSQATLRFEKNLKPELCEIAFNRAIHLILEVCGGKISSEIVDTGFDKEDKAIEISLSKINSLLGFHFEAKSVDQIFTRLNFEYQKSDKNQDVTYKVRKPFWRPDINIPEDLIEEISRIEGYDTIPATPLSGTIPEWKPNNYLEFLDDIIDLCSSLGFNEVINYSADSLNNLKYFCSEMNEDEFIKILNPMSSEVEYMKPTLKSGMIKTLSLNSRNLNKNINLFEVGTTFKKSKKDDLPVQEKSLVVGIIGNREKTVWNDERKIDFYDTKSFIDNFFKNLKIQFDIGPKKCSYFQDGMGFSVKIGNEEVGEFGEISQRVSSNFDVKNLNAYVIEIDLKKVFKNYTNKGEIKYQQINKFPVSKRDISFILDDEILFESILNEISNFDLIIGINVIDIYKDKSLGDGNKSLTVRMTYGSKERTLSGEEIDNCEKSFLTHLSKKIKFDIRD